MCERDDSRHLAVGAGAPSDPDVVPAAAPDEPSEPSESGGNGYSPPDDGNATAPRTTGDVVQAVADFLDDLVDDPTFAHDPRQAHES